MSETPDLELIRRFKACAQQALPGRVVRVVLFGSRARGAASPESDWDLAVFLRRGSSWRDANALADAAYDLILESGERLHPIALGEDGSGASSLLLGEIERDGVPV